MSMHRDSRKTKLDSVSLNEERELLFVPFDRLAEVEKYPRNLPHWKQAGVAYFVTFRLADSLPAAKLRLWMEERDKWTRENPDPWSHSQRKEYNQKFPVRFEAWLDAAEGACVLVNPAISEIVEGALRFFDSTRYILDRYVVMPNHVHVLFSPQTGFDPSKVLHSWKSYTAHEINRKLGRKGTLWQDENFDHIVRSVEQLCLFRDYISDNPQKGRVAVGRYRCGTGIGLELNEDTTE